MIGIKSLALTALKRSRSANEHYQGHILVCCSILYSSKEYGNLLGWGFQSLVLKMSPFYDSFWFQTITWDSFEYYIGYFFYKNNFHDAGATLPSIKFSPDLAFFFVGLLHWVFLRELFPHSVANILGFVGILWYVLSLHPFSNPDPIHPPSRGVWRTITWPSTTRKNSIENRMQRTICRIIASRHVPYAMSSRHNYWRY